MTTLHHVVMGELARHLWDDEQIISVRKQLRDCYIGHNSAGIKVICRECSGYKTICDILWSYDDIIVRGYRISNKFGMSEDFIFKISNPKCFEDIVDMVYELCVRRRDAEAL